MMWAKTLKFHRTACWSRPSFTAVPCRVFRTEGLLGGHNSSMPARHWSNPLKDRKIHKKNGQIETRKPDLIASTEKVCPVYADPTLCQVALREAVCEAERIIYSQDQPAELPVARQLLLHDRRHDLKPESDAAARFSSDNFRC